MRVTKVTDSLNRLVQSGLQFGGIIDVGIQHSTPVLMNTFPTHHHYLFEPVVEYYPHIRKNYASISHDLVPAAVTNFDGTLSLKTEKKTRGDEISHSYISQEGTSGTRTVDALQLDTYFRDNPGPGAPPYFMKIDVEGPDVPLQIMQGAQDVLRKTSVVMIELTVDRFMERSRFLDDMGFAVWDICDLCYYDGCLWQADLVFVRNEIKEDLIDLRPMHVKPMQPKLWQSGF